MLPYDFVPLHGFECVGPVQLGYLLPCSIFCLQLEIWACSGVNWSGGAGLSLCGPAQLQQLSRIQRDVRAALLRSGGSQDISKYCQARCCSTRISGPLVARVDVHARLWAHSLDARGSLAPYKPCQRDIPQR